MKKKSRLGPVPLHGPLRHVAQRRDFRERKSAEEVQLDELGERWIQCRQLVEGDPQAARGPQASVLTGPDWRPAS